MTSAPPGFRRQAARLGATVRSAVADGAGWRWRVEWRGVELGAWNDMDGVAVVADIGPWDEWVGLQGHPPDPTAGEALAWAVMTLEPWLAEPAHADRIATRSRSRATGVTPGGEAPPPPSGR